ncbi:hypothetical protein DSECCO2_592820 [anaerobic digester metagenome]
MTSYKKYKSATGVEYNFYVSVDGSEYLVSFNGPGAILIVSDPKMAKAIEASVHYKSRKIILASVVGEQASQDDETPTIGDAFPDVKNMGDAVEVLTTKYGVGESEIARKAQVLAKAEELGVIFPNYK